MRAQYCTGACRIAAYRLRHKPLPSTSWWDGKEPRFSTAPSRAVNSDGTPTRGELAERLLEIASGDDDGEPKTGRRFYYLALSYGYIKPDMGDTAEAKDSRDAAYDRIGVLGTLRKMGRLDWDMVLDLTRELDEWQTYGSPREARAALRERYDEDRWLGNPTSRSSSSRRIRWSPCASRWRYAGRCRSRPRAAIARSSCSTTWRRC